MSSLSLRDEADSSSAALDNSTLQQNCGSCSNSNSQSPNRSRSGSTTSFGGFSTSAILAAYGCEQRDLEHTMEGMDCYGDERGALNEYERFFNSQTLSDVILVVGEESFYAHKIVLVKSSDVFEKMLSQQWSGDTKREVELVEDRLCIRSFPSFLRYLYCCHIVLHYENALPILILADKYNVKSLRKACLDYAVEHVIPSLPLKEIFHVWFQYGTKCGHQSLISSCIAILAQSFQDIIASQDWEREWLSLEREQLAEFLRCSDLTVASEFELWQGVFRWLTASGHPERQSSQLDRNLSVLVSLVRFPLMTPDELSLLERSTLIERHAKIFQPQILAAYKFNSLPLASRKEFNGLQYILRNYTDLRWDKRLTISNFASVSRFSEVTLRVTTKASAVPIEHVWEWELKVHPKGFSQSCDEFRCFLSSNVILDQTTRPVEFLLSLVDDRKILRSVTGKKNFSKTRYTADLEMEKKVSLDELLFEDSQLLVRDTLCLQLSLRPIID